MASAVSSVYRRTGRLTLHLHRTQAITASRCCFFTNRAIPNCQSCVASVSPRSAFSQFSQQTRRQTTNAPSSKALPDGDRKTTAATGAEVSVDGDRSVQFRDRYIPMTRKTLLQHLLQEPIFLTDEEKKAFETFSLALDTAIVNRHKGILTELKTLFDPINPDKDTIESRRYNRRERLDLEFWLLQKLSTIMEKANFHELPKLVVEEVVAEHNVNGVLVSVNPEKYDVIRYWVVGKTPARSLRLPWYRSFLKNLTSGSLGGSTHYFKRVVVAVRLKQDDRLFLKAFREVPADRLDQILPAGSVRISTFDRYLLLLSGGLGAGGILAESLATYLGVATNLPLAVTGISAGAAAYLWTSFKNRQQVHLVEISKMLYFKNIINNRGLLTLLMDKAQDEIFKEVLLTYTFLLTTRPPSARDKDSAEQAANELGSMPESLLQQKISNWIHFKTGSSVKFDPSEGIKLLSDLGILTKDSSGNLHVLPLKPALGNLPHVNPTLSLRIEEYDLVEGFEVERSILQESDTEYTLGEKLRKYIGWF